jgi:thiol-disulfide isomerase/thioredoxin
MGRRRRCTTLGSGLAAALAFVVLAAGCSAIRHIWGPPADARVSVVSVVGAPSGDHLLAAAKVLEKQDAVYRATPDLVRAEITVWTRPDWPDAELLGYFSAHRLEGVIARGRGSYRPPVGFPQDSDARILTITGQIVPDLDAHTVPGKVTVFDFYADWCGPCRRLDAHFARVLTARKDVAVRKLNIVDFNSPLAARWLVRTIPFVVIYNRSGRKIHELTGNDPTQFAVALGRATISKD